MTKILIADDSAFARLNCKKVLTKGGHDVVEAANGLEAVALFQSERPDVVFWTLRCRVWTVSLPWRRS